MNTKLRFMFIKLRFALQMLTDHARHDSVMQYASVQLEAKRRILERKVIPLGEIQGKESAR